ncbi:MAG: DNA-J related domain-containing protein [Spongiibacteraceae bacterium]
MLVEKNPLVFPILNILKVIVEPISEHALIARLQQLDTVNLSLAGSLNLFQTHFMVMNALYYLQGELIREGHYLSISALSIYLQPMTTINSATHSGISLDSDASLREYYLDWDNFKASAEEIESLLAGFWRYYRGGDKKQQALAVLKLPRDADWPTIKKTYRSLIAEQHPDKGGDALMFIEIRQAYEILLAIYAER